MAKRIVSWERKRKRLGYFFILPFIIGAVFFLLIHLPAVQLFQPDREQHRHRL